MALLPPWVRLSPAFNVFPSLQRFAPTFAPRCVYRSGNPSRSHPREPTPKLRADMLSFYHDIGVLVFAGSSVEQVNRIGGLIQRAVADDRLQRSITAKFRTFNVKKFAKCRIPTEDWHIDAHHRPEEGVLSTEAILHLSKKAAFKWAGEALEKIDDEELKMKTLTIREDSVRVKQGPYAKGIIHQTVNGPRRLPVDAFIWATQRDGTCIVTVELFTVGTAQYLGKVDMRIVFYSVSDVKVPLTTDYLLRILKGTRSPDTTDYAALEVFQGDLRNLEKEIWMHRVPGTFIKAVKREHEREGLPLPWEYCLDQKREHYSHPKGRNFRHMIPGTDY